MDMFPKTEVPYNWLGATFIPLSQATSRPYVYWADENLMIPSGFASIWTNTIGFGKRKRRRRASVREMVKKQEALWTEYEGPADRRLSAGPFLSCFGLLLWKYDDLPIRRRTSRCPRISSRVLPGHHAPWHLLCSDGHLRLCSWGCRGGIMAYRSFLEQSTINTFILPTRLYKVIFLRLTACVMMISGIRIAQTVHRQGFLPLDLRLGAWACTTDQEQTHHARC